MKRISVTHFCRRPAPGAFSIERVFQDIRAALPSEISVVERGNKRLSRGILPRLRDAWSARLEVRDVNHIVGDVHYLTYFLPRKKTILTVHDTVMVERERGLKRLILWFFWFWLPVRCCNRLTAVSEESRRRILALVAIEPERIEVIPNPVGAGFKPAPPGPREGPFRLLHIGTKPNKNLERIASALKGLEIELTIIGRLTATQQALLSKNVPNLRLLVDLDDEALRREYIRAEALLFVSLDEGFGLPILEAQATGRAVITSNRAPMNEVAGGAALLVNPEDENAIRDVVAELASDRAKRESLVLNGFRNVERFSATNVAMQYAELYKRVAQEGRNV